MRMINPNRSTMIIVVMMIALVCGRTEIFCSPNYRMGTQPDSIAIVDTLERTDSLLVDSLPISRREFLSVKTNLLFYGVYMPGYNRWCPMPNVALEYYPKKGHFTYGASLDFPWWQDYDAHKYFQIRNYQVEARYYLDGSYSGDDIRGYQAPAFKGFYAQAYAHIGLFGICFDANRGWVGETATGDWSSACRQVSSVASTTPTSSRTPWIRTTATVSTTTNGHNLPLCSRRGSTAITGSVPPVSA